MTGSILIAEDDATSREMLSRLLSQRGYAVVTSIDGEDALAKLSRDTALVVLDLRMPKLGGFDCMKEIRERNPETPVIVVSSAGTKDAVTAMKHGAYSFLQKPYKRDEIVQIVENAISDHENALKRREHRDTLTPPIAGRLRNTRFSAETLDRVSAIENNGQPILISGERGTAKFSLAEYIHGTFKEHDLPLVHCSLEALPLAEVREELLGGGEKVGGRLALAAEGTLLLSEIGRAPYGLQQTLLEQIKSAGEVQWIATSKYDLKTLIEQGFLLEEFREIFGERVVRLAPLRERRADIQREVAAYLDYIRMRDGCADLDIDNEALNQLIEYSWPGNIEQLERLLERAAISANGKIIGADHLFFEEVEILESDKLLAELADKPLREIENFFISWQLRKHRGNRSAAARSLGITDRTIYNRMKQYSL